MKGNRNSLDLTELRLRGYHDCKLRAPGTNLQNVQPIVLAKCHRVSRYRGKCKFIYGPKKTTAFLAPIVTKLTGAQRN
jgi:hypothetical protein